MKNGRTDLAVEVMEKNYKYEIDKIISGMNLKKCLIDKEMSKKIGKKEGIYYNLDKIDYYMKSKEIIKIISGIVKEIVLEIKSCKNILIVGLGNPSITPDSLGPLCINKVEVNRHLEVEAKYEVSAITPGVMGQTGMESSDIIKAIADKFKPDLIIVIDALACNNIDRMCKSIQISTAGINPGSGVGNHRKELSKETLHTNVLAIGVPTVCDLSSIIDCKENYFITPNDIDQAMDILSLLISEGINKALI
ncbi:MAG: GPR endopeptidase [Anaeroplasma sp.]